MTPFDVGEVHRFRFSLGSFMRGEEPIYAQNDLISNEWEIPLPPPPLLLAEFEDDMVDMVMWLGDDVPAFPPCFFAPRCSILCLFLSISSRAVLIGSHAVLIGFHAVLIGCHAVLIGSHAVLIGSHALFIRAHAVLIGLHAVLIGSHAVLIGPPQC